MPTFEEVQKRIRARIQANNAVSTKSRSSEYHWAQESMVTWVTTDNALRISKVKSEEGGYGYEAWSVAFGVCPPERIGGPFQTMREAKAAAEAWARGDPVQANL